MSNPCSIIYIFQFLWEGQWLLGMILNERYFSLFTSHFFRLILILSFSPNRSSINKDWQCSPFVNNFEASFAQSVITLADLARSWIRRNDFSQFLIISRSWDHLNYEDNLRYVKESWIWNVFLQFYCQGNPTRYISRKSELRRKWVNNLKCW